jgi:hypothetical protein
VPLPREVASSDPRLPSPAVALVMSVVGEELIDQPATPRETRRWARTVLVGQCQPRLYSVSVSTAQTIQVVR